MADRTPDTPELAVDQLKRKARRRLVGAVVLALAAAVVLPLLLEKEPKPLGEDVSVRIPPIDDTRLRKFVKEADEKSAAPEGGAGRPTGAGRCDARSRERTAPAPAEGKPEDRRRGRRAEVRAGGADASRAQEIRRRRSRARPLAPTGKPVPAPETTPKTVPRRPPRERPQRCLPSTAKAKARRRGNGSRRPRPRLPRRCCPAARGQCGRPRRHLRPPHPRPPTPGRPHARASSCSWPRSPTTRAPTRSPGS